MTRRLVMKFGGTSVGNAEAIQQVVAIVQETLTDWPQTVVVVSAMSGVTNALLKGAHTAAAGDATIFPQMAEQLRTQHHTAIDALLRDAHEIDTVRERVATHIHEFETLCHAVQVLGEASPRALDAISSLGERMSMHLVAAALREAGVAAQAVRATELIRTDDVFQSASPDMAVSQQLSEAVLGPLLADRVVPVVTGFIGSTANGTLTTLGRGGSDFTAGILGAVLNAAEVWIWTDVNGVMTADPRVAPAARTLPTVAFREVSEMAYFGAKVLHPKTVRPVVEKNIPLRIKNTFQPDHPGTLVVTEGQANGTTIKCVTAIKGQTLITVEGRGMIGVPGIAARTFSAVARTGSSVILISQASSEQSICFSIDSAATDKVIASLNDEFRLELHRRDIDRVWAKPGVDIITVVGIGMQRTPGVAGRIFSALGNQQINVIAIAQGSSECSISLMVFAADSDAAVRAIHALIVE